MARMRLTVSWVMAAVLMAVAVWVVAALAERVASAGPEFAASRYLLPMLSITLVVLALALAGLLIRNLVRLAMDRRRGILGSKLRAKLVFFLLGFVLIPALMMVYGSGAVIKRSVEALVRTPVEEITRYSREIVDDWNDFLLDACRIGAERLGPDVASLLDADPSDENLSAFLERWRRERSLSYVMISTPGREPRVRLDPEVEFSAEEVENLAALAVSMAEASVDAGRAVARIDNLGRGLLVHAAVPFVMSPGRRSETGVASVGLAHTHEVTTKMRTLAGQADAYHQFRLESRDLLRLYLTLIVLVLLVTLFLATWIGFYMGRRITEPIQEVAAAAREISTGNLGIRVQSTTGDEVGVLVDSFNDMAAQLQESREVISRSNADLRRSNLALDERRRYIETLVANLSTAVISVDSEGLVTTSNPAVERILGKPIEIGRSILEALRREALKPLNDLLEKSVTDGFDELRRELDLPLATGTVNVAVQISSLRGSRQELLGTLVMIEDLTDLMRAQRAATWREVARRIAHEIKNPLTPIQLAAQRLRKKFMARADDLDSVIPEAADSIEREVAGLKHLVDEFSRYARMPEVAPKQVDIREVVDSVLALYKGQPDVQWRVETEPGLDRVKLDPDQMRRAIINLVDNAIAAMDGSGTIRLVVNRVSGKGLLRIEVSDTGPGISAADRDRLFVPYFSTKQTGTGLGLAIVLRVVTEHRGTIRVEKNEPHGARFVMEIPA